MAARLIVERGAYANQIYDLTASISRIGRGTENEVVFKDPEISRHHAQIIFQHGVYFLEDLGSTNGTFLNGQRVVGTVALEDNDTIDLGESIRLTFVDFFAQEPIDAEHDTIAGERPLAEQDTPPRGLPPIVFPPREEEFPDFQQEFAPPPPRAGLLRGRRWLSGCGCLALLLVLCLVTFFLLDAYDQGRLLYCGPLRSLFELLLGPFGFSPACS